MSDRERRLVLILAIALPVVLIIRFGIMRTGTSSGPAVVQAEGSVPLAEKRLDKLRKIAATLPGKEEVLKLAEADLALREKGLVAADTSPQAQAHLLEIARRIGKTGNLDIRGEFGQARALGTDYGEVTAAIQFECHPEQFVNFMADLSHEAEIVEPLDIRIGSLNPKEKTITVRMTLGGVVSKKLVPEKKRFSF